MKLFFLFILNQNRAIKVHLKTEYGLCYCLSVLREIIFRAHDCRETSVALHWEFVIVVVWISWIFYLLPEIICSWILSIFWLVLSFETLHYWKINLGRYEDNFIDGRRKHLQKWLTHVTEHPVLSYSNTLKHFLSVTDKDVLHIFP